MLPSWPGAALCMLWQWEGLGLASGKWWVLLPVALTAMDAAVRLCRVCSLGTVMHLLRYKESCVFIGCAILGLILCQAALEPVCPLHWPRSCDHHTSLDTVTGGQVPCVNDHLLMQGTTG